jgi:hypothetical protein
VPDNNEKRQPEQQSQKEQEEQYRKLSREEIEKLAGEPLPERAAMSLVNANLAIPINVALAANILSDNAIAAAEATQTTPIDQSTGGMNPLQGG